MIYCGGRGKVPEHAFTVNLVSVSRKTLWYRVNSERMSLEGGRWVGREGGGLLFHHSTLDTIRTHLCVHKQTLHTHMHTHWVHQSCWEPWLKFPPCSASLGVMVNDVSPRADGAPSCCQRIFRCVKFLICMRKWENTSRKMLPLPVHWAGEILWKSESFPPGLAEREKKDDFCLLHVLKRRVRIPGIFRFCL